MEVSGGSGKPQPSRIRSCTHSAAPSALSSASAWSAWHSRYSPSFFSFSARADPLAGRRDEERDGVERSLVIARPHEVGETEPLAGRLPRKRERPDGLPALDEMDRVPFR